MIKLGFDGLPVNSHDYDLTPLDVTLSPDAQLHQCTRREGQSSPLHASSPAVDTVHVKRGYRDMSSLLSCGVLFEYDPVWLWSIRPNSWNKIYVTISDELILRQNYPGLFLKLSSKLETIKSTFQSSYPEISPDFMWISGGRNFIDMVELGPNGSHVYWLSKAPRRIPTADTGRILWTKVLHRNVGGMTEARATFGIDYRSGRIKLEKDVQRSLAHVLKYSIRPMVCDPNPLEDHYTLTNLLSLAFPRRPVLYPTYMSRTGWGLRQLTDDELSACFELPDYVKWNDRFLRDIVPLQMFRSIIDSVVSTTHAPEPLSKRRITVSASDDEIRDRGAPDVVWMESLGRWLSGSWADAEISDKAVKSDNAPVDFRPWHRRIQLLFPCSTHTIGVMERFATRRWRFNVCRSLFNYLRFRYGRNWKASALSSSTRYTADLPSGPRKRARLSMSIVSDAVGEGGVRGRVQG